MRVLAVGCIAILAACARTEEAPETDTATGTAAPAATTISLADVAGTWNMTSTPESGTDTSRTTYVLTATANSTGWSMKFPQRAEAVPVRVIGVAGDSVVIEAGPFPSVRRQGVQVSTHSILRRSADRLVGTTHARYATTTADSTLTLRTEGSRAP